MAVISPQPKTSETETQFDPKECWYPVTYKQDFPKNRPLAFSLYDEALVLFSNKEGQLICLKDRCPHRAARLSDGQIIDGKIECLYHGWQFGKGGQCLHIPQLEKEAKIPANSCVKFYTIVERQGIIWLWGGNPETAKLDEIPIIPAVDNPEYLTIDMVRDLPYDQTYLIENVIDPAHVPISHDGTRGGGNKENAQPLEMEVLETSIKGIQGKYRGIKEPNQPWNKLDFIAPNLILYQNKFEERKQPIGLALYSIPLGKNRCRLLSRSYFQRDSLPWIAKIQPLWLIHLNTNKILEQDLPLIVGQTLEIEQSKESLKELYLPLKTSDVLVIEYRKWLDEYGSLLPFCQGYETSLNIEEKSREIGDRYTNHTQHCHSCRQAYKMTKKVKKTATGMAIILAACGLLLDHSWLEVLAVSGSLFSVGIAIAAKKLKTKFERAFTR